MNMNMKKFGGWLLYAFALASWFIYSGWMISSLWGWYVVPFGMPHISIAWAIGLAFLIQFLRPSMCPSIQVNEKTDEDCPEPQKESPIMTILRYAIKATGFFLMGYVAHFFI
jgi:hypothetical protein